MRCPWKSSFRQSAVFEYGKEKPALFDRRQQHRSAVRLLAERARRIVAVDIVDIAAVRGDIGAAEALRRRNALAERFVLCFPLRPMRCKFRSESRRIGIEDHAVDRLKIERRLMDVLGSPRARSGRDRSPARFPAEFRAFPPRTAWPRRASGCRRRRQR